MCYKVTSACQIVFGLKNNLEFNGNLVTFIRKHFVRLVQGFSAFFRIFLRWSNENADVDTDVTPPGLHFRELPILESGERLAPQRALHILREIEAKTSISH